MDRKSVLHNYINAAMLRLRIEKTVYTMQTGLFFAVGPLGVQALLGD